MSARTLPVTPAERACATVLRAFITWNLDGTREVMTLEYGAMLKLGDFLSAQGLTIEDVGDPTDAGAALLARVEAAERTPETLPGTCQGQMRAYRCALPVGHTGLHADEGRFTLWPDAADTRPVVTLAGATPIDAPPAKEPR